MTALRTAAQQALEALEAGLDVNPILAGEAEEALRAALAQRDEPEAYGYASRLAVAIWEKHYKDTAPQWKLLDDLMGVLTQIDNMTSGLTRLAQQAEPVEPVAWIYQNMYTEQEYLVWKKGTGGRNWRPLYAAPPQRKLVPLTETEIEHIGITHQSLRQVARAVERAVWEKNHG